VSKDATLALG